jgi:hypothetical protein
MKIEKNIPLPIKYPFAQMEVGDSFLLPEGMKRNAASVAAMRYGNPLGRRFTIRKTPEGFRCWRVA